MIAMHSSVARYCVPRAAPAMAAQYHTESEAVLAEIGVWFAYRTHQLRMAADLYVDHCGGHLVGAVHLPATPGLCPDLCAQHTEVLWPGWFLVTTTAVAWLVLDPHQYRGLYRDVDELIPRIVALPRDGSTPVPEPVAHPAAHVGHVVGQDPRGA
jgi:hypothetical protein